MGSRPGMFESSHSDRGTMSLNKETWLEYTVTVPYAHGPVPICGLCGNSGYLNTFNNTVSGNNTKCGIKAYCICPNGRTWKRKAKSKNGETAVLSHE